jgi:hypothetical protein
MTLHERWRRMPSVYRAFLQRRLRPGGASLLARDVRLWPSRGLDPGYAFQVGSPSSGWTPTGYTDASGGG